MVTILSPRITTTMWRSKYTRDAALYLYPDGISCSTRDGGLRASASPSSVSVNSALNRTEHLVGRT